MLGVLGNNTKFNFKYIMTGEKVSLIIRLLTWIALIGQFVKRIGDVVSRWIGGSFYSQLQVSIYWST